MSEHYIKDIGKVEYVGHEDSVTMGTYNIEEIEKCNKNKVDIIWEQSQQIEKLKEELKKSKQEKISFAVAELEKVRVLLFDAPYEFDSEEWCWFEHQISNLIAELTHQHEDKGE